MFDPLTCIPKHQIAIINKLRHLEIS